MAKFIRKTSATGRPVLYVTFHRHGMRAPIGNPLNQDSEVDSWSSELPTREVLEQLANKYPVRVHDNNPEAFDIQSFPFGCITSKGVNHLIAVGRQLKERFQPYRDTSHFKVHSTNFQRTQVSVQSLLLGLDAAPGTEIEVVFFLCLCLW